MDARQESWPLTTWKDSEAGGEVGAQAAVRPHECKACDSWKVSYEARPGSHVPGREETRSSRGRVSRMAGRLGNLSSEVRSRQNVKCGRQEQDQREEVAPPGLVTTAGTRGGAASLHHGSVCALASRPRAEWLSAQPLA